MKLITVKCPNCTANLEIDPSMEFCYCQHCGTKLLLEASDSVTKARIDYQAVKEKYEFEKFKLEFKRQREKENDEETWKDIYRFGRYCLILIIVSAIVIFLSYYIDNKFF